MKYDIKKLPKSQIEILFELPFGELDKPYKEAVLEFGKNLKVEGFRPGHIPETIIEREVGKMRLLEETAQKAIQENYQKVVSENNLTPVSQPQVEILKLAPANPLEFKILVFILPEIKLPDYKKIAAGAKKEAVVVTEKEIEDSLLWLQKSRAKLSLKNGAAQKGDFVEIEYSSFQLESGKTYKDAFFLGEGRFVSGFEQNLEGAKDSEEKDFSVKFPVNYAQKDLAGKDINFKVKIKSVQKAELTEIGDEFAKSLGKFENLQALKKNIKEGIALEKERQESDRIRSEILGKISEASTCEIPEVLIESEKKRTPDLPEDQAKKRIIGSLVLRELAKRENIAVSEEEIKKETEIFLRQYPDVKTAENQFDAERLKEYIKDAIANEKTFKLLENLIKK
ncbi:MAG: trigger factor [Parcubacteria group bacterium]